MKGGSKAPTIVMAHGFAGVKEMLPGFPTLFARAGFVTLNFDYRYFGESEGEPRCQVFPLEQVEDIRNAVTWVSERPEVDPERIGIWGTSYGGGIALYAGTYDRRVKAVVSQVPFLASPEQQRAGDPQGYDEATKILIKDRIERYKTGVTKYWKVVSKGEEPCFLPGREPYDEYMALKKPNWRNQVTLESLEKIREFDPTSTIRMLSPTALLIVAAEKDTLFPSHLVKEVYEKALKPKALSMLPIGHFGAYFEPWRSKAASLAIDWYRKHL
jgi:hypothetical protein